MKLISYKVQETGGWFYEAPTRQLKPSQRCPQCGHVHKKKLSERTHACVKCGHTEPRDVASARIVYAWLRQQLTASDTGQELSRRRAIAVETATIAPQAFGGR